MDRFALIVYSTNLSVLKQSTSRCAFSCRRSPAACWIIYLPVYQSIRQLLGPSWLAWFLDAMRSLGQELVPCLYNCHIQVLNSFDDDITNVVRVAYCCC